MNNEIIETLGIKESGLDKYYDSLFTLFHIKAESNDFLNRLQIPHRINGASICICLQGNAEIIVDSKRYIISKNDMLAVFPKSIFHSIRHNEDTEVYSLGISTEFLANIDMKSAIPLFLFIAEHPCISLSEDDKTEMLELCEMLQRKSRRVHNPYSREISEHLIINILYEISTIYTRRKPIEQHSRRRNEEFFSEFMSLVTTHYRYERGLEFYASRMCVTPKHLSLVVKQVSGRTAAQWISSTVVTNARTLIKSSNLTIAQISDYLNFANPSFFCQYIKKHTGRTPKSLQEK